MKRNIFLLDGDNYGWALDQDNYSLLISLKDDFNFINNIKDADILFSPWIESFNLKKFNEEFHNKELWCGVDNPLYISWYRQKNLRILDLIDLWIVYSEEAIIECQKYSLPFKKIQKFPLTCGSYQNN